MVLGIFLLLNIFQAIGDKPLMDTFWPAIAFFAGLLMVSMPDSTAKAVGAGFLVVGFLFSLQKLGVFDSKNATIVLGTIVVLIGIIFCVLAADRVGPGNSS